MNADAASLDRLADIVAPPPAPWWPPAPGWFLVAGLLAIAIVFAAVRIWRTWKHNAYRRAALAEIGRITAAAANDPHAWSELPEIVKRTALAAWPRSRVAALASEDWLRFLDQTGHTTHFTHGPGRQLIELAYNPGAPSQMTNEQSSQLLTVLRGWIEKHSVSPPEAKPC
jgi:hypothetical protein